MNTRDVNKIFEMQKIPKFASNQILQGTECLGTTSKKNLKKNRSSYTSIIAYSFHSLTVPRITA